ncbi:unnamed protein product [Gulo gulo]|uniref:Uncharacterized protein n=1 Tax=Gulo gulo TaxID=48420 RepID=A0A9X9Q3G7_GULGU|nr:unnamed protein product [Gulo gulo]
MYTPFTLYPLCLEYGIIPYVFALGELCIIWGESMYSVRFLGVCPRVICQYTPAVCFGHVMLLPFFPNSQPCPGGSRGSSIPKRCAAEFQRLPGPGRHEAADLGLEGVHSG